MISNNNNQKNKQNITKYQKSQQEIFQSNLHQQDELTSIQNQENTKSTNSHFFENSTQPNKGEDIFIQEQDIFGTIQNKDIVKITSSENKSESQMISLNNNNNQLLIGAGETGCSDQIETGKEIGSETLVPAQNQYEEDDSQICELLQQAQEHKENQQHEQAEKVYFDVLNLQKQKYGSNSYQVASTYKKLASMFQKVKDFDSSLQYYTEALNICKNQGGSSHTSREATCLISMSNIYLLKENVEEAQQFVNRALHIYNTQILEDEQMKPLLISQALRLKRKIDMHEKQKQYEERQIALSQEQTICSICLEDIQKNKRVRQLSCGHIYHIKCIAQWLQLNSKCPYCRDILPKPH